MPGLPEWSELLCSESSRSGMGAGKGLYVCRKAGQPLCSWNVHGHAGFVPAPDAFSISAAATSSQWYRFVQAVARPRKAAASVGMVCGQCQQEEEGAVGESRRSLKTLSLCLHCHGLAALNSRQSELFFHPLDLKNKSSHDFSVWHTADSVNVAQRGPEAVQVHRDLMQTPSAWDQSNPLDRSDGRIGATADCQSASGLLQWEEYDVHVDGLVFLSPGSTPRCLILTAGISGFSETPPGDLGFIPLAKSRISEISGSMIGLRKLSLRFNLKYFIGLHSCNKDAGITEYKRTGGSLDTVSSIYSRSNRNTE
ncbi:hypothetical protein Anapl_14704 [Anas platyrhynchos]|uniref:Uncharacterized protein n=1 Tax=Anas platyrhynchos TaxID=8839 RepID=R0LEZ7_ANAPL|nr:hypothetical protein Anapl_14704 [Anas platyrhynchos]